ncbi:MAG TPA: F0F1 ATP synthase subunit gamma [Propionibacteriaceae bacterium]|nr:F0F1 ATP synthase subunit gamma [Propionibacteriaceae bacterium]
MPASLRELRQRRNSVAATQKITRAMELIAASRIIKADRAARAALPYTSLLNRAVATVAQSGVDHPLTTEVEKPRRAAVVLFTSDRGLAGAYSANAIKMSLQLTERLRREGCEVVPYVVGNKGIGYLRFRKIDLAGQWNGISDAPKYEDAVHIADTLIEAFLTDFDDGGVDEIYCVYTRMRSMLIQEPRVRRVLPIEVVEEGGSPANSAEIDHEGRELQFSFEPDPESVLDTLLSLYVRNRIWFYLLESAASQLASQQRAMKSATDNAQQLIERLTRQANQARQAEITQEISEIVGGAGALADLAKEE